MAAPRVLVLRAPGTNCDVETAFAFESAGAIVNRIHVQQLIDRPILANNHQILCFPGGFSYGDDIASGRVLATQLIAYLPDMIESFRQEDRLVLGICNGFQIMIRLGIFFEDSSSSLSNSSTMPAPLATLTWNQQGRFEDRWVHLKVSENDSPFLRDIDQMFLPMAHAEGRFVTRPSNGTGPSAAETLQKQKQIPLRYCRPDGFTSDDVLPHPDNPNGAEMNVAGLCDESGRVFGLMPHPERHLFPTQHPFWTRRDAQPEFGDGMKMFQNAVDFFA
jgi:phosphoribosylformylglycinamidine synthase